MPAAFQNPDPAAAVPIPKQSVARTVSQDSPRTAANKPHAGLAGAASKHMPSACGCLGNSQGKEWKKFYIGRIIETLELCCGARPSFRSLHPHEQHRASLPLMSLLWRHGAHCQEDTPPDKEGKTREVVSKRTSNFFPASPPSCRSWPSGSGRLNFGISSTKASGFEGSRAHRRH